MPETTVTLYPNDKTEKPRTLTVPINDAAYWARRVMVLLPEELAYIQMTGNPRAKPAYLGHIKVNDDLANVRLREARAIQFAALA